MRPIEFHNYGNQWAYAIFENKSFWAARNSTTYIMKSFTLLFLLLLLGFISNGQAPSKTIFNLLVGTNVSEKSQGIYVYSFNSASGECTYRAETVGIESASYFAIAKDRRHVYAVSESDGGSINSFSFDAAKGQLVLLNNVSSGGSGPCYVSMDDKSKFVFAGNYGGGSVTAIPVLPDGSLSADIQSFQHEGKSVKPNQDKPHVHAAVLSPDNRYLFVPDLGTDKINIYSVDYTKAKPLAAADPSFAGIKVGGGPRHFTFHPNGKYAYVIHENTGDITGFAYQAGKLKELQTVSMSSPTFAGNVHASDIHVSPDGKFLYGSMRGDIHALGIYTIDKKGKLKFVARQSTLGKIPRNFVIDPTGNFLLVGNQNSDEIIIFRRDQKTGLLTDTGKKISIGKPVCLKFVAVE
jgi:6-phosphogluconolactonase